VKNPGLGANMKTHKLLATSGSLEGIALIITEYFCGSMVELQQTGENIWSVSTGKGTVEGQRVVFVHGRYRFEEKID